MSAFVFVFGHVFVLKGVFLCLCSVHMKRLYVPVCLYVYRYTYYIHICCICECLYIFECFFLQYPQMHFLNMHILYVCFTFVVVCGISAVPSDALCCVIRQWEDGF